MTTAQPTALVVDDEPHIRYMLDMKLRERDFRVLTATSGPEGLDLARQNRPDVVITDLQMPGGDGLEMCEALRATPETAEIPIIMLTARGHRVAEERLARTNILHLLAKPFSPRELIKLVLDVVGEQSRATAA